ncbi:mannan endo-1,4-beta-mannosidase-like isoform X1 [Branchiostoma lanceolatum]|uniref:mannan endo-1,4-beta-mannosidase-like isoform X1 n=1 Tax=Branchiostoma lanceolatum TaxID=7740 RepID=UPI003451F2FE
MFRVVVLLSVLSSAVVGQHYLSTEGQHFKLNGQRIFLSGLNMAWCRHGYDFGGGAYNTVAPGDFCPHPRAAYQQAIRDIRNNGGNSLRVWLHVDGRWTPEFSSWGSVTQPDSTNQLINDLKDLLSYARARNVLVFLVLWNGAHHGEFWERLQNLIWDDLKLDTYVEQALKPLAHALRNQRALGGWEIMNEPEGSLKIEHHSDPCYDTSFLQGSGAGWAQLDANGAPTWTDVPRQRVLRFINRQAAAIKEKAPNHLVTVGSWSELGQGVRNLYSDGCLQKAGGVPAGVLDFYQIHTYTHNGNYGSQAPFVVSDVSHYTALSGKPVVIGEFSQVRGGGMTIMEQFVLTHVTINPSIRVGMTITFTNQLVLTNITMYTSLGGGLTMKEQFVLTHIIIDPYIRRKTDHHSAVCSSIRRRNDHDGAVCINTHYH